MVTTCFPARVKGQGGVVIQLVFPATNGLLFGNHIVDASSLVFSFYQPWCGTAFEPVSRVWCVV